MPDGTPFFWRCLENRSSPRRISILLALSLRKRCRQRMWHHQSKARHGKERTQQQHLRTRKRRCDTSRLYIYLRVLTPSVKETWGLDARLPAGEPVLQRASIPRLARENETPTHCRRATDPPPGPKGAPTPRSGLLPVGRISSSRPQQQHMRTSRTA